MKLLLGVGGSDDSFGALDQTVQRVTNTGDDLTVMIVENPESDRELASIEHRVHNTLEDAAIDADLRHVSGDPGSHIVETAEQEAFDQIVLGGGEQSPMGKIRLGQIAEFVLLNSHVTVTLVR